MIYAVDATARGEIDEAKGCLIEAKHNVVKARHDLIDTAIYGIRDGMRYFARSNPNNIDTMLARFSDYRQLQSNIDDAVAKIIHSRGKNLNERTKDYGEVMKSVPQTIELYTEFESTAIHIDRAFGEYYQLTPNSQQKTLNHWTKLVAYATIGFALISLLMLVTTIVVAVLG